MCLLVGSKNNSAIAARRACAINSDSKMALLYIYELLLYIYVILTCYTALVSFPLRLSSRAFLYGGFVGLCTGSREALSLKLASTSSS